jgi:hypothetical protein
MGNLGGGGMGGGGMIDILLIGLNLRLRVLQPFILNENGAFVHCHPVRSTSSSILAENNQALKLPDQPQARAGVAGYSPPETEVLECGIRHNQHPRSTI